MMGVDVGALMRTARGMLAALDRVPEGLQATVDIHLETGNNMGISEEDFVDTLEWMEEELQDDLEDSTVKIPINKKGARVVYTFNPREVKYYPLSIQAAAKIFNAAGEDWTVSTDAWDVTNYALFSGDDKAARTIARRMVDAVEKIGARWLIMAECGHGFRALRWEGENWLGRAAPFWIRGFVPVMAEYIQDGRLHLDPSIHTKLVTYHDPCNQARNGGIIDEPRYVLANTVQHFVEMEPHGIYNYCCGGGGGMLAMTEYAQRRVAAGKIKADQIAATGAEIVATSCHNCLDQLAELNRHYELGVKIKNLSELVADAIIWPSKPESAVTDGTDDE
jgi:Fe-S oxidoreductase